MNLIFLYGPPATGKYTVATELEKQTGYKLLDDHIAIDLSRQILPEFDERLFELARKVRLDVFKAAAKYNKNLIFTYVYTGQELENDFINATIKLIRDQGGNAYFVQFVAPLGVILSRISQESRKQFRQLVDKQVLKMQMQQYDIDVSIPVDGILKIDTSVLQPTESARKIIDSFNLR